MHWRRKWQPTPVFLPGESQGQEAWWAAVYGAAQSWTRRKRLSSSSKLTIGKVQNAISVWSTNHCILCKWKDESLLCCTHNILSLQLSGTGMLMLYMNCTVSGYKYYSALQELSPSE